MSLKRRDLTIDDCFATRSSLKVIESVRFQKNEKKNQISSFLKHDLKYDQNGFQLLTRHIFQ